MINALLNKKNRKRISWMMLSIMTLEMIFPALSFALSSGPVQPEIQSFEPVGTTDMVDLFTGDFVYNIPLLDVEGYPLNISYHGGVTMEQEASWVGLGWNISPGAINRAVRGLPDEFDGDTIEKEMNIKPEVTKKLGLAAVGEVFGVGDPYVTAGGTLGGYLTMSNYRGVSVDFTASSGVNLNFYMVSAGINVGASIGSQAGASVDYGASVGVGVSRSVSGDLNVGGNFNLNTGGTYSPRTGLRQNVGFNTGLTLTQSSSQGQARATMSTGTSIPIGLQNYTAAVSNACYMNTKAGQLKLGGTFSGVYLGGKATGTVATVRYDADGSRRGFGYLNLADADNIHGSDLLDFSREKDGMFNTTMQLLPQSQLTYDVYNVSGQGTGGSFRPFRNDIGSIYDPAVSSTGNDFSGELEGGIGDLFQLGGEVATTYTNIKAGPWDKFKRSFGGRSNGYYEDVYYKEAGELTDNNESYVNAYSGADAIKPEDIADAPITKPGTGDRVIRANHIYTLTGRTADTAVLLSGQQLYSYKDTTGFATYPVVNRDTIARVTVAAGKRLMRKPNHINEIVQTQKDGRRYVYGLPVMNNVQREATFAVDPKVNALDAAKQLINYSPGTEDSKDNARGRDHFYSSVVTPSYVSAHLLTGVLSADYVDVTGNGISDDDLGTYTKFNYSRKSADYRWRSPIESGKAQYSAGYLMDPQDDKGSYMIGSREQWMLHSVETRNYVAEFFVSPRKDARGVTDRILNGGLPNAYNEAPYNTTGAVKDQLSYKLDSIVLYNKHDRFINKNLATPIKTVFFTYDYSLCPDVSNADPGYGKLTLKKIQLRYGTSNLNMSAAYGFTYSANNPGYNTGAKDRWGMYKPNDPACTNFEFPFTTQSGASDDNAAAWSLTQVSLPSGGVIKVDYEADDYAYVQDQYAMEMTKIVGMGNSTTYKSSNLLYMKGGPANNVFFFNRRKDAENPALSPRDNYLRGTKLLYYNMPVLFDADHGVEQIKGYAEVGAGSSEVGYCSDSIHGYVRVGLRKVSGTSYTTNPVTYTALNVGRYNLPQIIYPGNNPNSSDIANVVAGLKASLKEMMGIAKNPLAHMLDNGQFKEVNLTKAFIRLTSPGLKKKGGGQRVKSIKFYDNWAAMAGGNEAVYGKQYSYTIDDGQGTISSGVASYEPMTGGDELPQRVPVNYIARAGVNFPPNDPIELYQEQPVGESFYPAPVVGYRSVRTRSINSDKGRSSQTEDVSTFYTARDFPIRSEASAINTPDAQKSISTLDMTVSQQSTQGFSIFLNDMHGKPRATEHWQLKPAGGAGARELINGQYYTYQLKDGRLSGAVPVLDYNNNLGRLAPAPHTMGLETEVTLDSREHVEVTKTGQISANLNVFYVPPFFTIPVLLGYGFDYTNTVIFRCATATRIVQQYGVLSKVTSNNQGAVTEMRNEVFDRQTGNALITSVNNEFNDRVYNVSYPAYWAYKEMGPVYENFNLTGTFTKTLRVDTLGTYAPALVNYNPYFSSAFGLPSNMPVIKMAVGDDMPRFKVGDEMLLYTKSDVPPVKTWTMGYTSDVNQCYLVLAAREPYKTDTFWTRGKNYDNVAYRVIRSGNRNRLGETIQTYSTTDSTNIFPQLQNNLQHIIDLQARTYKPDLTQRFGPNMNSDSLNPFVTGKAGIYRPQAEVQHFKNRTYTGQTTRTAGTYATPAYWQTELDKFQNYCADSIKRGDLGDGNVFGCPNPVDTISIQLVGDSLRVRVVPHASANCHSPIVRFLGTSGVDLGVSAYYAPDNRPFTATFGPPLSAHPESLGFLYYETGCCALELKLSYLGGGVFTMTNMFYLDAGGKAITLTGTYYNDTTYQMNPSLLTKAPVHNLKKIMLGKVGHYSDTSGGAVWINTQNVTKYNAIGQELENKEEGLGYNSAVYGYNQQLPVSVARNARQSDILSEGFEDYALLQAKPDRNASYLRLQYSPFAAFLQSSTPIGTAPFVSPYALGSLTASAGGNFTINKTKAHTGYYSLFTNAAASIPLNANDPMFAPGYAFAMNGARKYVVSVWLQSQSVSSGDPYAASVSVDMSISGASTITKTLTAKSPVIDGWQLWEATADMPAGYNTATLKLGSGYYYDDLRIFPLDANSKSFVYDPVTRKLMATLDENNYATFYEYDAEGNLVRTKRETERGIVTVTESRSTPRKQ